MYFSGNQKLDSFIALNVTGKKALKVCTNIFFKSKLEKSRSWQFKHKKSSLLKNLLVKITLVALK